MALDPNISLSGRPISINAPDPLQTLLTVAQLKNMQSQQQLRDMQMLQLAEQTREYQAIQAPGGPLDRLRTLGQGGGAPQAPDMVAGSQLRRLPPGGGAITQAPMNGAPPPGPPGQIQGYDPAADTRAPADVYRDAEARAGTTRRPMLTTEQFNAYRADPNTNIGPAGIPAGSGATQASEAWQTPLYNQLSPTTQGLYPNGPPPSAQTQPGQNPPLGTAQRNLPPNLAATLTPPEQAGPGELPPGAQAPAPPMQLPGAGQQADTPPLLPPPGQAGPGAPPLEQAPGAATQQPGQQTQTPVVGSGQHSAQQYAILKEMIFQYPRIGPHIAKPLVELDQQLLAQQKGQLEFQSKAIGLIAEGAAGVMAQPEADRPEAWTQLRQMYIQRGIPGAEQMPVQYDPQRVQGMAINARTEKERIDQQLTAHQQEIDEFGKHTDRLGKEIDQAKLGEVEYRQDAAGNQFPVRKYPGANTGRIGGTGAGGVGPPAVNPATGQPYKGMDAQKMQFEQEQALSTSFQEQTKPYRAVRDAYNQVQTARNVDPQDPIGSDTALLDGFQSMLQGGRSHLKPEELGSWMDTLRKLRDSVSTGQALLPGQREQLLAQADKIYLASEQVYNQQREATRARTKGMPNVRPEAVAPDIRANVRPYTDADVQGVVDVYQQSGKKTTPEQVEAFFQKQGRRRAD